MKLWKISQDFNNRYDTYDSLIVAAETEDDSMGTVEAEEDARGTVEILVYSSDDECIARVRPNHLTVEYIGEAKNGTRAGIILGSFNAGSKRGINGAVMNENQILYYLKCIKEQNLSLKISIKSERISQIGFIIITLITITAIIAGGEYVGQKTARVISTQIRGKY